MYERRRTMIFSYYPGCTLRTTGKALDESARKCAAAFGVTMEEIPDWQCCGAVYPQATDEIATRLSSARALIAAKNENRELLTLCSACHHVIKRVNNDIKTNETIRERINTYLGEDYSGETNVIHYLEMLRDRVGFDKIKEAVKNPLKGRKIAAYYGCMLLRPAKEMAFDNPENPSIIEDFIKAIGAEPVIYSYRNECCGGYVTMEDKTLAKKKAQAVVDSAAAKGAEMIITACPLCLYNLDSNTDGKIPVRYFTELLAEALGEE